MLTPPADNAAQTYSFVYDSFGNVTSMKVGSRTLASYQYGPNNGLLLSQTYGNGDIVAFTYDPPCRVKITTCSERHLPAPIPQPHIRRCAGTYQAKRKINSTIPSGMVLFSLSKNPCFH